MTVLGYNTAQVKDFLSHLSTFKGDLSSIAAPTFVLAPKSAIEIPSAWASRHALFLQVATESHPSKRALLVAKNYLCSLKQLVDEGGRNEAKKPLTPFLGELFLGFFQDRESTTHLIAEQVSHHPPVTAWVMYNKHHGISSTGFTSQKASFSASNGVMIPQSGYAVLTDQKHDERHVMTMPTLFIKGIFTGYPYPEIQGPCYIGSSAGYVTKIDFEGRGAFGLGPKNRVLARIYQTSCKGRLLYSISGQWNGELIVKDAKGDAIEKFHIDEVPLSDLHVQPLDNQSQRESRRAWSQVFQGVYEGNAIKVNSYKRAIEESQRSLRANEAQQGVEWKRLFFSKKDQDREASPLIQGIRDQGWGGFDPTRTAGVWEFVGAEKAENLIQTLD